MVLEIDGLVKSGGCIGVVPFTLPQFPQFLPDMITVERTLYDNKNYYFLRIIDL